MLSGADCARCGSAVRHKAAARAGAPLLADAVIDGFLFFGYDIDSAHRLCRPLYPTIHRRRPVLLFAAYVHLTTAHASFNHADCSRSSLLRGAAQMIHPRASTTLFAERARRARSGAAAQRCAICAAARHARARAGAAKAFFTRSVMAR